MSKKINTDLDLLHNELENVKLHQNAGASKAGSAAGEIFADTTTDQVPMVQRSGGAEPLLFGGQATPTAEAVGSTASVGSSVRGAREDHRHAMPGLASTGVDGFMAGTDKTKLDASTPNSGASTLVQRDAAGRFQVADPSAALDAVNKQTLEAYVTGSHGGVVRAATTANITNLASGAPNTLDGITLNANDLVLVKDQTTTSANGVYIVNTVGTGVNGAWVRAPGYDIWGELASCTIVVDEGTANQDTIWLCTSNRTGGTLGTTAVVFTELPTPMATLAGAALIKNGNVIDFNPDGTTIEVASDQARVKDGGISTAKIANDAVTYAKMQNVAAANRVLGSLGTAGTDVVELTPAQLRAMLGSDLGAALGTVMRAFTIGNGVATSYTCNHAFNTRNVVVQVYRSATPWDTIETDVERTDANNVTIRTTTALASGEYTVVIVGGV